MTKDDPIERVSWVLRMFFAGRNGLRCSGFGYDDTIAVVVDRDEIDRFIRMVEAKRPGLR